MCYTVNELDARSNDSYKDNLNVVFVIDTRIASDKLEQTKEKILDISRTVLKNSSDSRIYIFEQNTDMSTDKGYKVYSAKGNRFFTDYNTLAETLKEVASSGTTKNSAILSDAVGGIISVCDLSRETYAFSFFSQDGVIYRTENGYAFLDSAVEKNVDISVIAEIDDSLFNGYAHDMYKRSGGIILTDTEDYAEAVLNHIYGKKVNKEEEDTGEYQMILATGLTTVELKAPITPEYAELATIDEIDETQSDTDEDGLPDYKEINFSVKGADGKPLIEFINGIVDLPKYGECIDIKSELTYVERGFNRFDDVVINDIAFLNYVYNTVNVLPIVSDPTSEDGDRDLISDIKDHYPLIEEDYNVFNHDLYLNAKGEFGCSGCGIIIQSPDVQDKTILTEDDYLKVKSLKNEFLQQISRSNKGELTLEEYEEFYSKSIFIYQIEIIRSQEQYAKQYDFKGPNGVYYSDFLESFDINNYINEYDSKGNIAYIHYYGCNVVNYEDNKINFDYTYVIVPQIFYLSGVAISFVADPFIAILGSATISSIPPIAFDEYSSSDFMWTCLMSITSSVFPHGIVNSSTKICDIVKTETQSTITDKRPMEGDKFVYVVWGCHCNHDYVCNFPGGNVVKTYWYREGELVLYE